jgi:hypothetical protein
MSPFRLRIWRSAAPAAEMVAMVQSYHRSHPVAHIPVLLLLLLLLLYSTLILTSGGFPSAAWEYWVHNGVVTNSVRICSVPSFLPMNGGGLISSCSALRTLSRVAIITSRTRLTRALRTITRLRLVVRPAWTAKYVCLAPEVPRSYSRT